MIEDHHSDLPVLSALSRSDKWFFTSLCCMEQLNESSKVYLIPKVTFCD